jgi:hypothetical protein
VKITYLDKSFTEKTAAVLDNANYILNEYRKQGYILTLRQLYYQFVARGLLENSQRNYTRLGRIVSDGRLAGYLDWTAIEDRTRNLAANSHWDGPEDIIEACAQSFRLDLWEDQPYRVEVWIEKEALAGVFARVCGDLDVAYFCCRGYTSQSEMWRAAMRLSGYRKAAQTPVILHFGDHDPSGIDMSRDITDRMRVFGVYPQFKRLALNMDQVEVYSPPPNPAKVTDSRFDSYVVEYGKESWELDALQPDVLSGLVEDEVRRYRDQDKWDARVALMEEHKDFLAQASKHWDDVTKFLEEHDG